MKKDKTVKEPIVSRNLSETTVVNVGDEIEETAVQMQETAEETFAAEKFEDIENTENIQTNSDDIPSTVAEEEVGLSDDVINIPTEENADFDASAQSSDNGVSEQSSDDNEESIEEITGRTLSPGRIVLKRFFRSKLSMTGLVILIALFIFSFIGPLFNVLPFIWGEKEPDYTSSVKEDTMIKVEISPSNNSEYAVYDSEEGASNVVYIVISSNPSNNLKPSSTHWFGTDDKGYDVFSRLMFGGRISLTIGFVVVLLETLIGVILGGIAGYFGKWVDQIIMRIVDIFNCVPTLPMLMIVGVALESLDIYGPSRLYIMMAMMTLFGWAGTARLVRGQILSLREQDFMLSAEASGLTIRRKIGRASCRERV